jgi:hypothetical protein
MSIVQSAMLESSSSERHWPLHITAYAAHPVPNHIEVNKSTSQKDHPFAGAEITHLSVNNSKYYKGLRAFTTTGKNCEETYRVGPSNIYRRFSCRPSEYQAWSYLGHWRGGS